jgi:hypothetical protein
MNKSNTTSPFSGSSQVHGTVPIWTNIPQIVVSMLSREPGLSDSKEVQVVSDKQVGNSISSLEQ